MYIKFRSLWKFVHVLNELEDKTILAFLIHHTSDILVFFSKGSDFSPIRWIIWIGQNILCMNKFQLKLHNCKHRKHCSVLVRAADS